MKNTGIFMDIILSTFFCITCRKTAAVSLLHQCLLNEVPFCAFYKVLLGVFQIRAHNEYDYGNCCIRKQYSLKHPTKLKNALAWTWELNDAVRYTALQSSS